MTILFLETPDACQLATLTAASWVYSSVTGSVTYDTTAGLKKSGLGTWKCDSGAGNAAAYATYTLSAAARRASFYICFSQLPASEVRFFGNTSSGLGISIDSSGQLTVYLAASTVCGGGSALTTGQVYRISLVSNGTSSTKLYVDGDLRGSSVSTGGTINSGGSLGWLTAPGASRALNFQHVYLDDDSSATDPGDVRVTAKLPTSSANSTFDTTNGTGSLADRPIRSDANYKAQLGRATNGETWYFESASAGDVDISGASVIGWSSWAYCKTSQTKSGDSFQLWAPHPAEGTDNVLTQFSDVLTTPTIRSSTQTSQKSGLAYPPGAAQIGMSLTVLTNTDYYAFDFGLMVAYISPSRPYPPWPPRLFVVG